MSKNNFYMLKNRKIIDILIGDSYLKSKNKMPYLSGPDICEIGQMFGSSIKYNWGGANLSRWAYMDKLIDFMVTENRLNELLSYLFNMRQFEDSINGDSLEEVNKIHKSIVNEAVQSINAVLVFSNYELRLANNKFSIHKVGDTHVIDVNPIKTIDIPYIKDLNSRTQEDLMNANYDSVITKSRTLIEEVLIYILEDNNRNDTSNGNINKLYSSVKQLMGMQQNKDYDSRVNDMLTGLQKIIVAVTELRNTRSDAHGVGRKRIAIRKHEAELVINSTITFLIYLLEVHKNFKSHVNPPY